MLFYGASTIPAIGGCFTMRVNQRGIRPIRFLGVALLSVLVASTIASAAPNGQRSSSPLSVRLHALADPTGQTRSGRIVTSNLSLPSSGPGSLQRSPQGEVLVTIRTRDTTAATQAALVAAGVRIRHVAAEYRTLTAFVAPAALQAVAAVDGVEYVGEALAPRVRGDASQIFARVGAQATTAATCPTGVQTEGVGQLKVDEARTAYGVDGTGVTVGVVSDSYNKEGSSPDADDDIATGDLPGTGNPCGNTTPVQVVAELGEAGSDEGRAMLQIVHDIAPKATLAFATAGNTMFEMADNIRALQDAGATITVDDIVFFGEPLFQPGPINVAISEGAAKGVTHFTAAGNANVLDGQGNNVTSYEAVAYRPMACPALKLRNNQNVLVPVSVDGDCHNFRAGGAADGTSGFSLSSNGGIFVDFQWAEPWYGVVTDLDIYVIDDATGEVLSGSNEINVGSQTPFEKFSFNTPTARNVSLVINRFTGNGTPRLKYVLQQAQNITSTEYNAKTNTVDLFGPSVGDHVAAPDAIGVGAVPYNDSSRPEEFSSLGPAVHYFGPVRLNDSKQPVNQPAAALASLMILQKPDVAATDGGITSFFGSGNRFYGTSAAAPHAAGVAALFVQRAKAAGRAIDHSFVEAYLEAGAAPIPNGSSAANGRGLVNARRSIQLLDTLVPRLYLPLSRR